MFQSNSPSLKYLDPSGVWMGPPDKREPKVISNVFEFPHSNISFPATVDKTNTQIRNNAPILETTKDQQDNSIEYVENTDLISAAKRDEILNESVNLDGETSAVSLSKVFLHPYV